MDHYIIITSFGRMFSTVPQCKRVESSGKRMCDFTL